MRNALHALCMQQETEFLSIHCTASYIRYSGAWLFYIIKTLSAMCFFMFFSRPKFRMCRGRAGLDVRICENFHSQQ